MGEGGAKWIPAGFYLFSLALLVVTPRSEFAILLILAFFAFASWYILIKYENTLLFLGVLALVARLAFFRFIPMLSDDYIRFIWDGKLILNGVNPFGRIPVEMTDFAERQPELLSSMNSPDYPSIYPPLHQLGFAFGALFGEHSVNGIRLFILLCEGIGLFYFYRSCKKLLPFFIFYLLNPLVILEGVGNLHFEAALLPFLAIALSTPKPRLAGMALGAAVLVKLNPFILVPAFLKEESIRRKGVFLFILFLTIALGFLPFISGLSTVFSGYDLYFRSFEFNASIYYLFSEIGKAVLGYNPIAILGPTMGVLALVFILYVAYRKVPLAEKATRTYLVFFLFSTTVHPWYVLPLVYLSLITGRHAILIWSFTVLFSYSHYLGEDSPKYGWIALEYLSLAGAVVYEYRFKKRIEP